MKSWVKVGLIWGGFMYLMMSIVFPLWDKKELTLTKALVAVPFWIVAGLIFGYVTRGRKNDEKPKE